MCASVCVSVCAQVCLADFDNGNGDLTRAVGEESCQGSKEDIEPHYKVVLNVLLVSITDGAAFLQ